MNLNYEDMRKKYKFEWFVNSSYYALAQVAGLELNDLLTNYKSSIKMYSSENIDKYFKIYGNCNKIRKPAIATPSVLYGHSNAVGVPLVIPKGNGDINYERIDYSLDKWIKILSEERDFSKQGMAPYFLEYREKLQQAFPGRNVAFNYWDGGPLTEAYTMLDLKLYYSLYDEPEKLKIMLEKIAYSVIRFKKFLSRINGYPYSITSTMCDDCATFVPHDMWEEFVIPYIDIIYSDVDVNTRNLHAEGMDCHQLKYLETLKITRYDPSLSTKLTPVLLNKYTRVPFIYRMCSIYHPVLDRELAKDFVYASVRDGASGLFTSAANLDQGSVDVVLGFIEACEMVEKVYDDGGTREDIGKLVSARGNDLYWDKWQKEYI